MLLEVCMAAYVIFDVEIRDPVRYQDFMNQVKPALANAGASYLTRVVNIACTREIGSQGE